MHITKKRGTLKENMATVEYQKLWYMLGDNYKRQYKSNVSYFFSCKFDSG